MNGPADKPTTHSNTLADARKRREAEALRANLARRKMQSREREQSKKTASEPISCR
ncbi:hypothetical protein [Acidiphilium sp.]|uniref:hypothetical protein n=1 Tax=Acidiphilium sp. TaxID=527 RepID=UPI003D0887C6